MRLLTIPEAQKELNVTKEQIWELISLGRLQVIEQDNVLKVVFPSEKPSGRGRRKKKDADQKQS